MNEFYEKRKQHLLAARGIRNGTIMLSSLARRCGMDMAKYHIEQANLLKEQSKTKL